MRRILFFVMSMCSFENAFCQKHKLDHGNVAFTTLHTAFPLSSFSRLFTEDLHPGVEIGTGFNWRTKARHDWFQTFQLGYSYHRFVQHSVALYSETGYRYKLFTTFAAEAKLGAGYLHAIPVGKLFKLEDDGTYERKTNLGRPQGMVAFSLGVNKKITPAGLKIFIQYQQRIQMPFIKSYVPLLPTNMLMAGFRIPCKRKTTDH